MEKQTGKKYRRLFSTTWLWFYRWNKIKNVLDWLCQWSEPRDSEHYWIKSYLRIVSFFKSYALYYMNERITLPIALENNNRLDIPQYFALLDFFSLSFNCTISGIFWTIHNCFHSSKRHTAASPQTNSMEWNERQQNNLWKLLYANIYWGIDRCN